MSLDTVELVMEFENAFGIQIPDAEAEEMSTISQATDTILCHIQLQPASACKAQILFYHFRRYFEENLGISRNNFLLTSQLGDLLPLGNREGIWKRMEDSLGWQLPGLSGADLNQNSYMYPRKEFNFSGHTFWAEPLNPPLTKHTIGDLIGFVFALNCTKLVALPVATSRYEVEKVVMGITSDKAGVEIQDIKPESSFTNDLGMD